MNSIFFEAWNTINISAGNIIRDSFSKTQQLPLSPANMKTHIQECVASIQTSSKGIKRIAKDKLSPIQLLKTRTNNPIVIL